MSDRVEGRNLSWLTPADLAEREGELSQRHTELFQRLSAGLDAQTKAPAPDPAADAVLEQSEAVTLVRRLVATELTERQRTALQAVMGGMPMDEVARRLDTNRNALYKLLHDGRLRLKRAFEERGLSAGDLLDSSEP